MRSKSSRMTSPERRERTSMLRRKRRTFKALFRTRKTSLKRWRKRRPRKTQKSIT
jgi:hypothetical protein